MSSSFTNGRISCTFTRSTMRANVAEDRNLNELAFVLIASGPQRGMPQPCPKLFLSTLVATVYMSQVNCLQNYTNLPCAIFSRSPLFALLWMTLQLQKLCSMKICVTCDNMYYTYIHVVLLHLYECTYNIHRHTWNHMQVHIIVYVQFNSGMRVFMWCSLYRWSEHCPWPSWCEAGHGCSSGPH